MEVLSENRKLNSSKWFLLVGVHSGCPLKQQIHELEMFLDAQLSLDLHMTAVSIMPFVILPGRVTFVMVINALVTIYLLFSIAVGLHRTTLEKHQKLEKNSS